MLVVPSGNDQHSYDKSPCKMGKSTISMIFNSELFVITISDMEAPRVLGRLELEASFSSSSVSSLYLDDLTTEMFEAEELG